MADPLKTFPDSIESGAVNTITSRFIVVGADTTAFPKSIMAQNVNAGTSREWNAEAVDVFNTFPNSRMAAAVRDGVSQFEAPGGTDPTPAAFIPSIEKSAAKARRSRMRAVTNDTTLFPDSRMSQAVKDGTSRIRYVDGLSP